MRMIRCLRVLFVSLLALLALIPNASTLAAPPNLGGPTRSATEMLALKRYVAAGDRAYVIGAEDGSFPPMGWHIRGEMGGIWAHPIKLLDGYWFALNDTWLPAAQQFTTGAGYTQLHYPRVEGLEVTRTEFASDDSPVVLVGLTVRNPEARRAGPFELKLDVRSELLAAYPWSGTEPSAAEFNRPDQASFDRRLGMLVFTETDRPWYALVAGKQQPISGETGDEFWGPVPPDQRDAYQEHGAGAGGQLRWRVILRAGEETTLWFAAAGSHTSRDVAEQALRDALADPEDLLREKVDERLDLLRRTQVDLPDDTLQAAFDWGKLNMADLRITVTDMQVRYVDEGRAYPPPAATLPQVTGIGAGFPDYPWYFGTDGAYTAFPLLVSGQWDTIKEHLRTIRDVSRIVNGDTGKVVHEAVTDGSVYWGANEDPGNTNETAQFATAVDLVWRWTGDDAFRDEMYDFIVDGLQYITVSEEFDEDYAQGPEGLVADDDLWPEGHGMVERPGMGEEKLDVTAYTWQALHGLADMAASKGDEETANWAQTRADEMAAKFGDDWWMGDEEGALDLYADSLCNSPIETPEPNWINYCREAGQQLQQRHWINATPAETLLAPPDHANALLDTLESDIFTGDNGLFHTGRDGGPAGEGELRIWTLPNSVMAVGEANYGRLGQDQALFYMLTIAQALDLEMPGALPEIVPSPEYDPFIDFRERAMFMQAWSSYGTQWPVIHHFLGIRPDVPAESLYVVPDVPESWPGLSVEKLRVGDGVTAASATRSGTRYTTKVSAPEGWTLTIGYTLPAGAEVQSVTLDGKSVDYKLVDTTRGREVGVETTTGVAHTLVVMTK